MKKLNVNKEACIGCGACVAIDSEHFDFGDDGLSSVISNENTESADCQNAMSSCPTNAISYVDEKCDCKDNCGCKDGKECTCGDECNCEGCTCKEN